MKVQSKPDLAHIIASHHHQLAELINNSWKTRTLYGISRCRTAAMGGHIDQCSESGCGKLHISYNSCRNRHCPKCQGHLREKWIADREKDLLNVSYFHVVFTLPDHLNKLSIEHPSLIYRLLFKTAWGVLHDFGQNPKQLGALTGMIGVLHTWGQNLSLHPHLHCIVPAGGITKSGKWKSSQSKGKFLFPVKQMSKVFRARFVAALRKEVKVSKQLSNKLFAKRWVIYCKQPFFGAQQVIEYLGRYSHKIAISNSRIQSIADGRVAFSAKDYRQAGKKVVLQLSESEFLRRFSLHILPKGFTRIRHYGILSSTSKKRYKVLVDQQKGAVKSIRNQPLILHRRCPTCKIGILQTVCTFDQRGPPKHWINRIK